MRLVKADDVVDARSQMNGETATHINGRIVAGTDVNTGYSWHLDPDDLDFVDMSTEVCDGVPSDVEAGTVTSDRYCPWSGKVTSLSRLR
ncbi:hypothetical protein [Streptomyces sp. NPDC047028]|uniref:BP74-related protein n=1 Tax=Streptomyces sp. NPDC047028 TaxID=3155793 RepID=UPI0033E4EA95